MFGSVRLTVLDRALSLGSCLARIGRAVINAMAGQARWRPTDLYAAATAARFTAAHHLIEQAADALDDDDQTVIVAARTWPWLGADFVYEETQR